MLLPRATDCGLPYTEARPHESLLIKKAHAVLHVDPNPHFFDYPPSSTIPRLFIYVPDLTRRGDAALVSALLFAFTPNAPGGDLTRVQTMMSCWLPLAF